MALPEAIERFVVDGAVVAMEGFMHLIPFAAGHEVIRQGKRDLTKQWDATSRPWIL